MEWRHRTTEEARKALRDFCRAVGTAGDRSIHVFTVPVDEERDLDCILSDVISERDSLLLQVDVMRPVVEAAIAWKKGEKWPYLVQGGDFAHAIDAYERKLTEKPRGEKCPKCDLPVESEAHREECADKREAGAPKCFLCGAEAVGKIGAEPRCEKHV